MKHFVLPVFAMTIWMRWKNLERAGKVLRIRELAMPRCMRCMTY
jgi:hypothetical protein